MSVSDWFTTFNSNIAITKGDSISMRYKRITQRLNTDFWSTTSDTAHSIYVGSYGRDTAINATSDVDMAFWLPWDLYTQYDNYIGNGQSALLQAVRTAIRKTYPTTDLGADGQVLSILFDDGLTFEILPCFEHTDRSFTYPDSNNGGSWKLTDPRAEIDAIRARNEHTANYNLKRLCRMMRSWKKEWTVPVSGILIDTMAYQFIADWEHRQNSYMFYDWMSRDFFAYMAEQDRTQNHWRAPGSARYVYRDGGFEYKATRCRNISLEAISSESKGHQTTAKSKWREIFGYAFPS